MDKQTGYQVIAASSTVLDAHVAVYYGWPIWQAWSDDILGRGLSLVMAALATASLAHVWVGAIPRRGTGIEAQSVAHGLGTLIAPDHSQGARHV